MAGYYFFPGKKLPSGKTINRLIVYKSKRKMQAWSGIELLKTYTISLGRNPTGHKQFEGDCKTPEGIYYIDGRNPNSAFYKNLGISYPNTADIAHAEKLGKPPGGDIKIHGLRNGKGYIGKFHRWGNWTAGCIAVTNKEMEELYGAVEDGTVIEILP
ncbi:L,D-transpeptidase family protein [uncultured Flavobacterium sp.]|uniref:L,D-transpeptidase family protein n=1 Tax=uncultured Flavobacterium sp. TaxID=165435 RepID=UPI0025EC16EB|nr:L,D-transpeptidase family protein [uncultured Flavobacterium sp.]